MGKNSEGGDVVTWGDPVEIVATIWAASGHVQAQMYGEHLAYVKNMEYEGTEEIKENDGICVFVSPEDDPDYIVKSVNEDYSPKVYTLERGNSYGNG